MKIQQNCKSQGALRYQRLGGAVTKTYHLRGPCKSCEETPLFPGGKQNISIGIPLNLSILTEMGYIQVLVENENSTKLQNFVILTYVRSFLAYMA